MACCGDRRRALYQPKKPMPATARVVYRRGVPNPPAQRPAEAATAPMLLRYIGNANTVVRGPVTGLPVRLLGRTISPIRRCPRRGHSVARQTFRAGLTRPIADGSTENRNVSNSDTQRKPVAKSAGPDR